MKKSEKKHILVLAAGSVGRRHLRNFVALGCDVSAMDPREDRLKEAESEVKLIHKFKSVEEALKNSGKFDGAVVASPTKFHISQTLALLNAGLPVLLEKPLAKTLEEARGFFNFLQNNKNAKVLLGYTYRWWPSLSEFKKKILSGELGKPLRAEFIMSAHLADWHPWENYQDFFMASKDLGGGALLDESHWLDLMIWFFGMPDGVFGKIEKISGLEIETDDNVDMLINYKNNLRVSVHLDLYGRPHRKSIKIIGEKGTLDWSFEENLDRNIMFMELAKDFIGILEGKDAFSCTVPDGINVLKVIEAARKSSSSGGVIQIQI